MNLVFGRGLEGALDELLGQDPNLDVPGLGGTCQEAERLVAVDPVPLHHDAYRNADVGTCVEGHAQLLDLVGVPEQGSGVGREEFSDLDGRTVEGSGGDGVQV